MRRILVTGSAGFIGAQLAASLMADGYTVYGLDNYNDGYEPSLKHDRNYHFGVKTYVCDLQDADTLSVLFDMLKPDVVIHLAARAGVRESFERPMEYQRNNILGTHNIIENCLRTGVEKVLYASTSNVYSGIEDPTMLPWKEEYDLPHQLNPYGSSKFTNECQFLQVKDQLPSVAMRFFTVYGPWGRPDMALFKFVHNIMHSEAIPLYNNGTMYRDWTYIDDIIQGVKLILQTESPKLGYNICSGKSHSLRSFVRRIEESLGKKATIELLPRHPADPISTEGDYSRLQKLGYKPVVSLDEGVDNFVNWYLDYYKL